MAVIKLSEREKTDKPRGMGHTVACWFDRAERFRPDDGTVKMLHGIYLIRKGKAQAAAEKLEEQASALAGEMPTSPITLGWPTSISSNTISHWPARMQRMHSVSRYPVCVTS